MPTLYFFDRNQESDIKYNNIQALFTKKCKQTNPCDRSIGNCDMFLNIFLCIYSCQANLSLALNNTIPGCPSWAFYKHTCLMDCGTTIHRVHWARFVIVLTGFERNGKNASNRARLCWCVSETERFTFYCVCLNYL